MAALNDGEGALPPLTTEPAERAAAMPLEPTTQRRPLLHVPTLLASRQFVAVVLAIGGMQLMTAMDGPVAVFALPRIQNELGLSDAGRSWVITAYLLTFGGLMLLGGRLGDTIGRKRAFIIGVALFTLASTMCGVAWDGGALVMARLLHGVAAAIVSPTCIALVATTFPKGPLRNAAVGVLGAMGALGAVMGLVVGGALTEVWWRLAFLVNVPIGLLVLYLARATLRETQKERMKLDVIGAALAMLIFTAAVFGLSMGPEKGWLSATTIGSGMVVVGACIAFVVVERAAENPIVPFSLFTDRNRLATFAAMFLAGGVGFTLTVLISLYVQSIMGYSPLRAGVSFIPFALAMAAGVGASSRLVSWFPPRVVVTGSVILVLGSMLCFSLLNRGMLYGSTQHHGIPYFPNLVVPIVIGAIGIGMISLPLTLSVISSVGLDRIGPASAISVMLQSVGGPVVLAVIQAAITSRALQLGGTSGPVKSMNASELRALDYGYANGLLWLAGVIILLGAVALFIGYTVQQVAQAQQNKKAIDAGEP
jgi:EmrB/QacA subfamily drug resistance transporter